MEATSKAACVIDASSIVLKILALLVHMYCNSCKHTQKPEAFKPSSLQPAHIVNGRKLCQTD
eukprot:4724-Heterococcus_DN1.PRE.3